ncbi:MAG: kinase/pyrophosphorylase [Chloroflexi bacterium SZAS-1]|jgi:regulator of PEP synthase PpsR (kinase-PPPase family)|nr:kinase/pyrophosphorylase [Chloroflexi bacterium SZAS-1]HNP86331.1 pyruvate, water dikinase regulatory protein [Kouleothrix sp.]
MEEILQPDQALAPLYILSGGAGALGKHIVRVALSQFPGMCPEVIVLPHIGTPDQLVEALELVANRRGTIIHTLVNPRMRALLLEKAGAAGLKTIDTIGDPLQQLSELFARVPLGQPGLYQGAEEAYLERIKAIEYTVEHDDGRNHNQLDQADVVLTGLSRVGKTPLSIYLSVLGWKVANVPLVREVPPPPELFEVDRRRVVGLLIDVDMLMEHRRWRQRNFGGMGGQAYSDPEELYNEIEYARRIFRKGGFAVINVTNKPIEESADQVIALISRYFEHRLRVPALIGR